MSRRKVATEDVLALIAATGRATNTDVAHAFGWRRAATTRGLERLCARGVLVHVLPATEPGRWPKLYAVPS